MDFSVIQANLETILGFSFGGISVIAIISLAVKGIKWLKANSVEAAVNRVIEKLIGKDINIDLTAMAKTEFAKIKADLLNLLKTELEKETEAITAQSKVLTHLADIQLQRKTLLSDEQIKALQSDTEAIRTHKQVEAKQSINIELKPIEAVKTVETKVTKKVYLE